MPEQLPATDISRPWWKGGWAKVYLTLLGLAVVATIALAVMPVPDGEAGLGPAILKMVGLGWAVGALDVLLAIAIGVGVAYRHFWRLHSAPIADCILGFILFILSTAAVVIFLFFACMAVIPR
jgi:hypothetical protein